MVEFEIGTSTSIDLEVKKPIPEVEVKVKVEENIDATEEKESIKNGTSNTSAAENGKTSTESETMLDRLRRQIEYYFGDVNLPHDKFIKTELAKLDGWFQMDLLLKFNKVNQLLNGVPDAEKLKQIVQALEGSTLIELSETKDKIRRNPEVPIPEAASDRRTIYLKGFHKSETKIDPLIEHFKKYEGFEAVIMRYYKEKILLAPTIEPEVKKEEKSGTDEAGAGGADVVDSAANPLAKYAPVVDKIAWVRKFKGSIFVVFKTEELAKAALDDITTYCGNPLIKMFQFEYIAMKGKEYQARQESRKRPRSDSNKDEEEEEVEKKEESIEDIPSGIFVKVTDIPKECTREKIKESWYKVLDEDKFEVAFIDFHMGDTECILRLRRENSGVEALESLKEKDYQLSIGDDKVKVSGLDEDAEKKYRVKVKQNRMNFKKNRGRGNYNRGGQRGGGGRGRKRGRYN